jgi:hypothetical protein
MEKVHPLVAEYHKAILDFWPPAFAKMNDLGNERKYTKIYLRLSYRLIQSHLRGDVTLAVCLINPAGSARTAVLDIDDGGEAALLHVPEVATKRRLIAFAQSSTNYQHDGSHVWLLFDSWQDPARFRHLAATLAQEANVKAENYSTRKSIRLPLGVHRQTGKRGSLVDGRATGRAVCGPVASHRGNEHRAGRHRSIAAQCPLGRCVIGRRHTSQGSGLLRPERQPGIVIGEGRPLQATPPISTDTGSSRPGAPGRCSPPPPGRRSCGPA